MRECAAQTQPSRQSLSRPSCDCTAPLPGLAWAAPTPGVSWVPFVLLSMCHPREKASRAHAVSGAGAPHSTGGSTRVAARLAPAPWSLSQPAAPPRAAGCRATDPHSAEPQPPSPQPPSCKAPWLAGSAAATPGWRSARPACAPPRAGAPRQPVQWGRRGVGGVPVPGGAHAQQRGHHPWVSGIGDGGPEWWERLAAPSTSRPP